MQDRNYYNVGKKEKAAFFAFVGVITNNSTENINHFCQNTLQVKFS